MPFVANQMKKRLNYPRDSKSLSKRFLNIHTAIKNKKKTVFVLVYISDTDRILRVEKKCFRKQNKNEHFLETKNTFNIFLISTTTCQFKLT